MLLAACIVIGAVSAPRNLLTNGDFSQGAVGFVTEYKIGDVNYDGNVCVGKNPHDFHMGGASITTHSGGNMLIVNGCTQADTAVWQETVNVRRHHKYEFSGLAASWGQFNTPGQDPSPARLEILINGKEVGDTVAVKAEDGAWAPFKVDWDSDGDSKAKIRIVDRNLEGLGNDFAISDLVFK